jgi:hypothetical protein
MRYDPSSRARLGPYDLARFTEPTLFHEIARTLCAEACLPRKELFESWEVARRVRRRLRGRRVVDLACGHGLVAQMLLLLDPALEAALGVDRRIPQSAAKVMAAMARRWPRLEGRTTLQQARLASVDLQPGDLVVSCHACGVLTDRVLDLAIGHMLPVAVLPCCQSEQHCDAGGLEGWMDAALAVDVTRAARLRAHGYRVHTQTIPIETTAKNRLLIAEPARIAAMLEA